MSHLFAGIDCGASGALVVLDEVGRYVDGIRLAENPGEATRDFLEKHRERILFAALELVNGMPGEGGHFDFGRQYERQHQSLVCMRIPFCTPTPATWQSAASLVKPSAVLAADLPDSFGQLDLADPKIAAMSEQERESLRASKRAESAKRKSKANAKRAVADCGRKRWPSLPARVQKDWGMYEAAFMADYARKVHLGLEVVRPSRSRPAKAEAV